MILSLNQLTRWKIRIIISCKNEERGGGGGDRERGRGERGEGIGREGEGRRGQRKSWKAREQGERGGD